MSSEEKIDQSKIIGTGIIGSGALGIAGKYGIEEKYSGKHTKIASKEYQKGLKDINFEEDLAKGAAKKKRQASLDLAKETRESVNNLANKNDAPIPTLLKKAKEIEENAYTEYDNLIKKATDTAIEKQNALDSSYKTRLKDIEKKAARRGKIGGAIIGGTVLAGTGLASYLNHKKHKRNVSSKKV